MKTLDLQQGSEEWLAVRLSHFTASEAPVMMGVSPYMSRDDLLSYKTTQNEKEVSYWTQKIYDKGHEVEALARPIAERILGEDLYPVTGALMFEGLPLLASFDGLTMMEDTSFEHKQWNQEKAAKIAETMDVEPVHYWQLEHQLLVSNSEQALFMMSDGTEKNEIHVYYRSEPERRAQLIAGWKQFQKDLENYEPKVYQEAPEPEAVKDLPAITYRMNGLSLSSNIELYKEAALKLVEDSKKELETDQDFADAELLCKKFKEAEGKLKLVQEQVLGEVTDIDQFTKDLAYIADQIRAARLNSEKQVKTRKESIRVEIMQRGNKELSEVIAAANAEVSPVSLPDYKADFAGAMKGKKTIKSLNEAVNDALSKAKIDIESMKSHALINLEAYNKLAGDHQFLFNDLQQIIMKDSADFTLLVESRISKYEEEAKAKADSDAALKTEREKADSVERIQAAVQHVADQGVQTEKKAEPTKANGPEQDIVNFLYNEFGIYANQASQIANAIIQGRVPHTAFTGKISKAA